MNKKLQNLINLAVPVVLIFGTISVYLFAKGYRYNFSNGEIEKTGVISIKTHPRRADVYIDDTLIGTTPKAIGGISEGPHTVRIEKEGYHPWTLDVNVLIEQLIPLEIQLFPLEPRIETLFSELPVESCADYDPTVETIPESVVTESEIIGFYSGTENQAAVFGHLTESELCVVNTTTQETTARTLELWSYPMRRQFWEINAEPELIAELNAELLDDDFETIEPTIDVAISPNGNRALVSVSLNERKQYVVINTNAYNPNLSTLTTINQNTETPPVWSNDSQHLILAKNNELRTYNVDTNTVAVITQIPNDTVQSFYWTSNTSGQLFYSQYSEESLSIIQSNPNGSNQNPIIDIPLKNSAPDLFDTETSGDVTEENRDLTPIDPELLLGISDMRITPLEDTMLFFSEDAIIAYSLDGTTTQTYSSENPEFLSFSPNTQSLMFIDHGSSYLGELWFYVEETDPLHTLGIRTLFEFIDGSTYDSFRWHTNAAISPVFFNSSSGEDGTADSSYVLALDTENRDTFQLTPSYSSQIAIDSSGDFAITRCTQSTICFIHFQ